MKAPTVRNGISLRLTLARSLSNFLTSFNSLLAAFVFPNSYCAYALHRHACAFVLEEVWKNRAKFAHFSADTKSFSLRSVFPWSVHFNDSSYNKQTRKQKKNEQQSNKAMLTRIQKFFSVNIFLWIRKFTRPHAASLFSAVHTYPIVSGNFRICSRIFGFALKP